MPQTRTPLHIGTKCGRPHRGSNRALTTGTSVGFRHLYALGHGGDFPSLLSPIKNGHVNHRRERNPGCRYLQTAPCRRAVKPGGSGGGRPTRLGLTARNRQSVARVQAAWGVRPLLRRVTYRETLLAPAQLGSAHLRQVGQPRSQSQWRLHARRPLQVEPVECGLNQPASVLSGDLGISVTERGGTCC